MTRRVFGVLINLCLIVTVGFGFQGNDDFVKSLKLKLDANTAAPNKFFPGVFQAVGNDLYYLNKLTLEIKIFDLAHGNTKGTIALEREGPNSVGPEPFQVYVVSPDSLLIYSRFNGSRISLIDKDSKVLSRYILKPTNLSESMPLMLSHHMRAFTLSNGMVYSGYCSYEYDAWGQYAPLLVTSVKSNETLLRNEPATYREPNILHRIPKITDLMSPMVIKGYRNEVLMTLPVDHAVYKSSDGFKTFQRVEVKSQYIDELMVLDDGMLESVPGMPEYDEAAKDVSILGGRYSDLFYNESTNEYYRIARLPYNKKVYREFQQGVRNRLVPEEYAVMVLNQDLEIIKERKFNTLHSRFKNFFVTSEGLWVQEREQENEDILTFYLLNLN